MLLGLFLFYSAMAIAALCNLHAFNEPNSKDAMWTKVLGALGPIASFIYFGTLAAVTAGQIVHLT